jgi:hypothetical protein
MVLAALLRKKIAIMHHFPNYVSLAIFQLKSAKKIDNVTVSQLRDFS